MADEKKKAEAADVLSGGQNISAAVKIGTQSALAALKALVRDREAKRLQRDLQADRAALRAPVLTDKALAEAKAAEDAIVRQEKAKQARGGGQSGVDADRMKAARDFALKKTAQRLTARQAGVLGQRKQIAEGAAKTAERLSQTRLARDMGLIQDASKILSDEDTIKMLGEAGKRKRKKKTKEIEEAATIAESGTLGVMGDA